MMKRILILPLIVVAACGGQKAKPADERIPVTVATAQQKDMPVEIRAIGSVQPLQTVAVRALVAGQLTRVWFREGDEVRRGQTLFTIDPRPMQAAFAQAQANLARDEAEMRNAEAQSTRYADLVKKDYVTREEFDKISAGAEAARAVVAADRAAIENARLQLSYSNIVAPLDGKTGSLQVHAGNIVRANDTMPLVVINQVHPINVQFAIPERDLGPIRASGMGMSVVASQQGGGPAETGRLTFIDNAVDPATGTIALKASFSNDDRALWPGQYVSVAVTLSSRPNAIVVPAQALQTGQRGQYVFVVKSDNGVEMRPVAVSQQVDQQAIIEHGVSAGETVVTDGQLKLTPKSKVEIKQSL